MTKSTKRILVPIAHIVVWLLFLSLPNLFNPGRTTFSLAGFLDDLRPTFRWANGLLMVAIFYLNYYILIPRLYFTKKYGWVVLSFVGCVLLFFLVNAMLPQPHNGNGVIPGIDGEPHRLPILGPSFNFFMFIIVYITSFAACVYTQFEKIKDEKLNAEISFLKAQMNPHFLFNTLNSIYSLTIAKSPKAPDAIIQLSELMRYAVSESNSELVDLEKELAYITNFVELQKLRMSDKILLDFTINGNPEGLYVAPFLLIPFVENGFKYGVNPEDDSDIRIKIDVGEDFVALSVQNNKVARASAHDRRSGLGLSTTQRRLDLVYPGRYMLDIADEPDTFIISLYIVLTDESNSNRR